MKCQKKCPRCGENCIKEHSVLDFEHRDEEGHEWAGNQCAQRHPLNGMRCTQEEGHTTLHDDGDGHSW